jgi:sterol desaturase/sphingolipid hydroxylase (fatty acid hydroxylase superfamily)
MLVIEILIKGYVQNSHIDYKEVITNLNSGHIILWLFRSLEVAVYFLIYEYSSLYLFQGVGSLWVFLLAYVIWDFLFYMQHLIHHKIPLFWAIHEVHHQGKEFNLSLGIRNSWYSSLSSIPFFFIMAIIGFPPEVFIVVSSLNYTVQFINHNSLFNRIPLVERIFVTPATHKIHHGHNEPYRDKNFGGTFLIWDKLFGTYQTKKPQVEIVLGVDDQDERNDPLYINNRLFAKLLGLKKTISKDVFTVEYSNYQILFLGLLIYAQLVFYIWQENTATLLPLSVTIFHLIASSIMLGRLSEGDQLSYKIFHFESIVIYPLVLLIFAPIQSFLIMGIGSSIIIFVLHLIFHRSKQ